jgi:microcompartment protein CcmL/EutN
MIEAVGLIELTSVGIGFVVEDAMLKAGDVKLVLARTICSGKYIIVVTGPVADATAAVDAGLAAAPEGIIDHEVIPRLHPAVLKALSQAVELTVPLSAGAEAAAPKAVGIIETFSGVSVLLAGDAAAKTGNITLLKIHLAMALGGKGYLMMAGSVSDVQMAVHAGAEVVRRRGLLVSAVTIPGPSHELFAEYI